MIKVVDNLKDNNNMLQNMVTVLNKRQNQKVKKRKK